MTLQLSPESSQVKARVTVAKIVNTIKEWREIYSSEIMGKKSLGFVPTMGALHKGHMTLIKKSVAENDVTVCSIFVNPTQFNNPNDLTNYPITLDSDKELLKNQGCDYIFLPNKEMIYPDNYKYVLSENSLSRLLCGNEREGHFDGVLTVVLKLLNIINCSRAYFGEKDWQQYQLIKGMAEALFLTCEIIPCPLIRESDGLAYSSRNKLLTQSERKLAPNLYKVISSNNSLPKMKKDLTSLGFGVEYIEQIEDRLLVAASLGKVRLIDNVKR